MAATTTNVTSIPAFLDVVEECRTKWFTKEKTWGPWFRGQSYDWPLQPTLYRYSRFTRPVREIEDELRQEFAVRAPSFGTERPQNSWEWYFLMQHCGAPTRLLDWTESALIALYFAVKGKVDASASDAVVWILEPWKLNELAVGLEEVIAPGAVESGMVAKDADEYKPWLPDRYSEPRDLTKQFPVAVYPAHFSRRISSQHSCFTVHGSDKNGFEHLPDGVLQYLRKVVIPGANAHEIETSLSVAGIDEVTIYPDLDGLGRWLASVLREESLK